MRIRSSQKKRWFFIPKNLYTFIWFAVSGGRGIIRDDFWGLTTISHPAYNSKNKKDDFSWFLVSKKLYTFAHFCGILEEFYERINPLRKNITFSFKGVQCFYFLKELRSKIAWFFFYFVHLNIQNFRHITLIHWEKYIWIFPVFYRNSTSGDRK